jgi:hypothetical protein
MASSEFHRFVETCVLIDPAGRGVARLAVPGQIEAAARSLQSAKRVVVATGFWIPEAGAAETDGPPGALELAAGLRRIGVEVEFLTDRRCAAMLESAGLSPLWIHEETAALPANVSHLVSIERLGRAADGRYYNMHGRDATGFTRDVDRWFLEAPARGWSTIGVGDGGNEIGMGRVRGAVVEHVAHGAVMASIVETDALVVAGTSNWGVWGILAELSDMVGASLLPTPAQSRSVLQKCIAAGMVDATSKQPRMRVDGLEERRYFDPLLRLRRRTPAWTDSAGGA